MRERGVTQWVRRLFRQQKPNDRARYGSELGFPGEYSNVVIRDRYRFAALEEADEGRHRVNAAIGYLTKVRKNAMDAYHATGDPEILKLINATCEELTWEIVRATSGLVEELGALGYNPDRDLG